MVKSYPITCVWEVTMGCNMRCKHCGSSCKTALPGELTTQDAYKFIDMCSDIGLEWINLSGGEPLTRKDLPLLIDYLTQKEILVNIISNGWLITEKMAGYFKTIPGLRVAISLDGTQEIHDKIRKPGAFEHAVKSFKILHKYGISSACITTITLQNIDILDEIKNLLISLGVECWQVQIGLPMGNLSGHCDWVIKPEDVDQIIDFCYETSKEGKINIYPADCIGYYGAKEGETLKNTYGLDCAPEWDGCHAGFRSFGMLHNGDILGCTSIRNKEFIEGNIKDRSLREIWEDPGSFKWRRGFTKENLKGDCLKCKHSAKCLGGCPNTRLSMNGSIYSENLYCSENLRIKRSKK